MTVAAAAASEFEKCQNRWLVRLEGVYGLAGKVVFEKDEEHATGERDCHKEDCQVVVARVLVEEGVGIEAPSEKGPPEVVVVSEKAFLEQPAKEEK